MHPGEGLAGPAGVADRQLRLLALAALASLGLHALIFTILPMLREAYTERPSPPPLRAQLAKQKPPPEPPRAEPPPPAPAPRQVTRAQPRVAPKPVPPQPAPVLSMEPAKPAAEPPAFTVAPAPAVAPSAPSATARTEPPPAAVAGPDPGSLARFRLELMEIARRYKRYPRIAQDNNWEGRVELRVAFGESGAMSALTVRKSAGRTVLDEEAQSMIRSALPQVAVPPALRGKAFALDVAVDFSLKDER